jgi:hypothetical protein
MWTCTQVRAWPDSLSSLIVQPVVRGAQRHGPTTALQKDDVHLLKLLPDTSLSPRPGGSPFIIHHHLRKTKKGPPLSCRITLAPGHLV